MVDGREVPEGDLVVLGDLLPEVRQRGAVGARLGPGLLAEDGDALADAVEDGRVGLDGGDAPQDLVRPALELALGELAEVREERRALIVEERRELRVLEGLVPERRHVDALDLGRLEAPRQAPGHGRRHADQLLRAHLVRLVEDDAQLLVVLLDRPQDVRELVAQVQLVRVDEDEDQVRALREVGRDLDEVVVAPGLLLLLAREDARRVDEAEVVQQRRVADGRHAELGLEGRPEAPQGPPGPRRVRRRRRPGHVPVRRALLDRHEAVRRRLRPDLHRGEVLAQEAPDEGRLPDAVLPQNEDRRLRVELRRRVARRPHGRVLERRLHRGDLPRVEPAERVQQVLVVGSGELLAFGGHLGGQRRWTAEAPEQEQELSDHKIRAAGALLASDDGRGSRVARRGGGAGVDAEPRRDPARQGVARVSRARERRLRRRVALRVQPGPAAAGSRQRPALLPAAQVRPPRRRGVPRLPHAVLRRGAAQRRRRRGPRPLLVVHVALPKGLRGREARRGPRPQRARAPGEPDEDGVGRAQPQRRPRPPLRRRRLRRRHELSERRLLDVAARGLPRDAPRPQTGGPRRHGLHEPLLPDQGRPRLDAALHRHRARPARRVLLPLLRRLGGHLRRRRLAGRLGRPAGPHDRRPGAQVGLTSREEPFVTQAKGTPPALNAAWSAAALASVAATIASPTDAVESADSDEGRRAIIAMKLRKP